MSSLQIFCFPHLLTCQLNVAVVANAVVVVAAVVVVVVVFQATMLEFLLDLQMIVSRPEKIRSVLNSLVLDRFKDCAGLLLRKSMV